MHTHTSKGARAQELERLQNTTHGPIHLQNIQNLYKRGCIGPFDFFVQHSLYGYSLGRRKGNSYALVPFPQFTSMKRELGALVGVMWFPFIKRADCILGPKGISSPAEMRK